MRIPLRNLDRGEDAGRAGNTRVVAFAVVSAVLLWAEVAATGQEPPMHYRHQGLAPPGSIGSVQLQRGGPLPYYFQPVEIRAPRGTRISIASQGQFGPPLEAPLSVGLLIAPVYRFKLSNIPNHEGQELFPTIEVIDRLYPPRGQERRFPIPIELNADDIELALEGKFVTRVVYLEDPTTALPVAEGRLDQHWFDAGPGVNPVEEADRWGRPLAIVRIGGRVPDEQRGPDVHFIGGSAPFTLFRPSVERPAERGARRPALGGSARR
ncbi:MAG TPA: hypothetical protein VG826_02880 [Pirellulales bacterium]|nr:hypothetical protein [Pirellulales bacterium]